MPTSLDELRDRLIASTLVSAEEITAAMSLLSETERAKSAEALVSRLVGNGKLTNFQAKRLFEGKADKLVLGNYVILDRLGEGGMGTVYKARHRQMRREVALKVVRPELLDSPSAAKRF